MRKRHTGFGDRVRAWWDTMPLMRSFFLYAAACVLVSIVASLLLMATFMSAYEVLQRKAWEGHVDVEGGPYIYDAQEDELVPAFTIDLSTPTDRIVFLGLRSETPYEQKPVDYYGGSLYNAETGAPIGYATLEMVRNDPSLTIFDWGGNYTEQDYLETNGHPYVSTTIDAADLADYDARERAERVAVDGEFLSLEQENSDFIVSNVGYYVSQYDSMLETPLMFALRVATGLTPFVMLVVLSIMFFRRFYRRRIGVPLAIFCDAAGRVAHQDLDFVTPGVPGREFSQLGTAFEKMRASLEESQRELWRTAEERRRLNAAFAHDLRTPVTVLKGTIEMAQMRAARGEAVEEETLRTLGGQVERLESYAQAMSGIAKLEDRTVERTPVVAGTWGAELRRQAQDYVSAARPELGFGVDMQGVPPQAELSVDRSLVEEVLGNLLSNACVHACGRVALTMKLDDERGLLTLRVSDDGDGFSPEALRRGCEPFFGEAKDAEHFGLGLNIVQTLTRLHGGTVELANADAGGGVVTVTFDVGKAA